MRRWCILDINASHPSSCLPQAPQSCLDRVEKVEEKRNREREEASSELEFDVVA